MDWKDEEATRLFDTWGQGHGEADDVLGLASLAVELAAARGALLRVDQIAAMWRIVESNEPFGNVRIRELLDSHATQGATVATLQAKVEALHREVEDYRNAAETAGQHRDELRAEVERLTIRSKADAIVAREALAEVERLKATNKADLSVMREYRDRWQSAESRLAAIRERAKEVNALGIRIAAQKAQRAHRTAAHRPWTAAADAAVSWVLEGDAPQEATYRDVDLVCGRCATWVPHRWMPSPDAGPGWRCSECSTLSTDSRRPQDGKTEARCHAPDHINCPCTWDPPHECRYPQPLDYPCSKSCTHDDAAKPGHPERVKERSEAVTADLNRAAERSGDWWNGYGEGHDVGADKMRSACLQEAFAWAKEARLHPWLGGAHGSQEPT